jgi:formylglycine-generating enzyme required for sulfatase activity
MRAMKNRGRKEIGKIILFLVSLMILVAAVQVKTWAFRDMSTKSKKPSYTPNVSTDNDKGVTHDPGKHILKPQKVVGTNKRKISQNKYPERGRTSNLKRVESWREPVTGMVFLWIPGGCFNMGSPLSEDGRDPDEGPVHEVCLDGFWMGKTEVTNSQYRTFKPDYDSRFYRDYSLNGDSNPVVFITWYEAKAFARWLTEKGGGQYHYRLPTEAEWEYAARAGTETSRFWGDDSEATCRYANVADLTAKREWSYWKAHKCDDGYKVTAPVGSFEPNAFGLHDMLGNVFEWCEDIYSEDAYQHHQRKNPIYLGRGSERVIRGGAWYSWPEGIRSAGRSDHPPEGRDDHYRRRDYFLGFRLVRTP